MKIAVIGAGAIGALVAGYLKQEGRDVILIGHPSSVKAIHENGLEISGARGDFNVCLEIFERFESKVDLVIVATKTQDLEQAIKENQPLLRNATVLTTQNGIRAERILAKYIPEKNILSSIVMFGSTLIDSGKIVHNFEGAWVIGNFFSNNVEQVLDVIPALDKAFPVIVSEDIKGMKYLKIFVNANNCIPAILGISMQEAFSDPLVSKISINIWREGLAVIKSAGISLVSLPDFPLERLTKLTSLPVEEAAKIYSGIMANLSKTPLYGSILQSIKRGKSSEIDYINGEFVSLAKENSVTAGLNEKLVQMVHEVEKTKKFFSKEELINATRELLSN